MARKRTKLSRGSQRRVSEKIGLLRREGRTAKEAAGMAYGMERSGRLGAHGAYHRSGGRRRKSRPHARRR